MDGLAVSAYDDTVAALEAIGLPVFRQGSAGAYPRRFYTFWNSATSCAAHYDNEAAACAWDWQVCYYTDDPETLEDGTEAAMAALRELGHRAAGRGFDVPSDEPTHAGRAFYTTYREEL
jgi:hypothetical protein